MPETITIEASRRVARVTLNRPLVRNAFNGVMIGELLDAFRALARDSSVRIVVLTGAGTAFCAGADLNWMRSVLDGTFDENFQEARKLAKALHVMSRLPQPLIGRISGPAMGGGVGLASVTDLSVASDDAFFALTEARVGLTPATISPYVIRRVGPNFAREMFLTSRRVRAQEAREVGLVTRVTTVEDLDEAVEELIATLLESAPGALASCKELLRYAEHLGTVEAMDWTASEIAKRRQSAEGQEGMAAFLEKRRPSWQSEGDEHDAG